jgi:hypothetical protein
MVEGSTGIAASRRVDDGQVSAARQVLETILETRDTGDLRPVCRSSGQPVEAGCLLVIVDEGNVLTTARVPGGQAGGDGAFATAAFGIQDHDVTHDSASLVFIDFFVLYRTNAGLP